MYLLKRHCKPSSTKIIAFGALATTIRTRLRLDGEFNKSLEPQNYDHPSGHVSRTGCKNALLTSSDLQAKLGGRGRTTIYRDVELGRLPKPVKLGSRLYWNEADIDAAIEKSAA